MLTCFYLIVRADSWLDDFRIQLQSISNDVSVLSRRLSVLHDSAQTLSSTFPTRSSLKSDARQIEERCEGWALFVWSRFKMSCCLSLMLMSNFSSTQSIRRCEEETEVDKWGSWITWRARSWVSWHVDLDWRHQTSSRSGSSFVPEPRTSSEQSSSAEQGEYSCLLN